MDNPSLYKDVAKTLDNILRDRKFGDSFDIRRFEKNQRATVESICYTALEGKRKAYILEAPTGTGKSIISMFSSLVLQKLGMLGYILTSDLGLQAQYESDFKRLGIDWGTVRGVDNYTCSLNFEPFSLGECQQRGMNISQASKLECASTCGYILERNKAVQSPVTLLNYSYWLIQQNYVKARMESEEFAPFPTRDFCFFDECHKVSEIVQGHFAPTIRADYPGKFQSIAELAMSVGHKLPGTPSKIHADFNDLFHKMFKETDTQVIHSIMMDIEYEIEKYLPFAKKIKEETKRLYPFESEKSIPPMRKRLMKLFDWAKDVHCKIEDYNTIIKNTDHQNIVKVDATQKRENPAIQLKCIEESYLMKKHFHDQSGFQVYMSATIGEPSKFTKINGINNAVQKSMASNFDYKKSPLIFFTPPKRLSYNKLETNFPPVLNRLDKILEVHKNQRGIIHSGTYKLSKRIMEESKYSDRLIPYQGSQEKKEALEALMRSKDGVIIGPSLIEGIDLKDDLSRFQIFFKVPYASLADEFVKAKMKMDNDWYKWKTGISILQGIGRSVRSEEDWAYTYLMDGCFGDFISFGSPFPAWVLDRVKIIHTKKK